MKWLFLRFMSRNLSMVSEVESSASGLKAVRFEVLGVAVLRGYLCSQPVILIVEFYQITTMTRETPEWTSVRGRMSSQLFACASCVSG